MGLLRAAAVLCLLVGVTGYTAVPASASATIAVNAAGLNGPISQTKILSVPYSYQGQTDWCYYESLSMVLQYRGKHVSAAELARTDNRKPDQSYSLLDTFFAPSSGYIKRQFNLAVQVNYGAWSFDDFRTSIDGNPASPVIVSTFGFPGHTVVVIGYSVEGAQRYLWVHDPSGYLTNHQLKTGATRFVRVSWEEFKKNEQHGLKVITETVVTD